METMSYIRQGEGRSKRALSAESEGRYPLTTAVRLLSEKPHSCTQKEIKEYLLAKGSDEWHHTGKYGRSTDYYDISEIDDIDREIAEGKKEKKRREENLIIENLALWKCYELYRDWYNASAKIEFEYYKTKDEKLQEAYRIINNILYDIYKEFYNEYKRQYLLDKNQDSK